MKINVVALKGFNEEELFRLAEWCAERRQNEPDEIGRELADVALGTLAQRAGELDAERRRDERGTLARVAVGAVRPPRQRLIEVLK